MLYSVPPFTAYDLPVEQVAELALHPNILGIKESSGDVPKIATMVEKTAGPKRTVNVTEIFNAVTRRMLAANAAPPAGVISAESLSGGTTATATATAPATPKFKMRTKEVSFQIAAGAGHMLLPSLEAGASAAVLAFAACAPTACYEVWAALKDGDKKLADLKQQRVTPASKRIVSELGIPGIKYACDLNGYYGGPARLPLLPLTGDERKEIERIMADLRN